MIGTIQEHQTYLHHRLLYQKTRSKARARSEQQIVRKVKGAKKAKGGDTEIVTKFVVPGTNRKARVDMLDIQGATAEVKSAADMESKKPENKAESKTDNDETRLVTMGQDLSR